MSNLSSEKLVIHYGSTRGAACGAPSGSLALSTSWKLVNCLQCIGEEMAKQEHAFFFTNHPEPTI